MSTSPNSGWADRPSAEDIGDTLGHWFPGHTFNQPTSNLSATSAPHLGTHHFLLSSRFTFERRVASFRWVRGEFIGKGSHGRVYLAMNTATGEMMAVKQAMLPAQSEQSANSRDTAIAERLRVQSEILKDFDHLNVVQYLGFEEMPTTVSLFMEYVPGGSISGILKKYGRFDDDTTKSFSCQILRGLEYLHSKGILHRVRMGHMLV